MERVCQIVSVIRLFFPPPHSGMLISFNHVSELDRQAANQKHPSHEHWVSPMYRCKYMVQQEKAGRILRTLMLLLGVHHRDWGNSLPERLRKSLEITGL